MKCEYLVQTGSRRLILIFAGWGTDGDFHPDVEVEGYDVMVVSGYTDLHFPGEVFVKYHTVCLFAWSLGVFMAAATLPFDKLAMAVAINGTQDPVSDHNGIPSAIFNGTEQLLNERNLLKFRKRMALEKWNEIENLFPKIEIEDLRRQLRFISSTSERLQPRQPWDRVYICTRDSIFPPENMMRHWQETSPGTEIVQLDEPHFVDLSKVVKGLVPSIRKVGERFRMALNTYLDNACVQEHIARELTNLIPETSYRSVLEIGPGAGVLSRSIAQDFEPREMDFVDLYRIPPFRIAPTERYYTDDAEDWIEKRAQKPQESYDLITSASAIQWFVNPKKFLANAASLLKEDGILAISTFLPGHFPELRPVNPFGLLYRDPGTLEKTLLKHFKDVKIYTDSHTLDFENPRKALSHLRATGVGGSAPSSLSIKGILSRMPSSLTYLPLYIIAKK